MSKSDFSIRLCSKEECKQILENYHYLSKESRGFKTKENYLLESNGRGIGVCIFTGFPVPELLVGMFGISRDDQEGFYELSRLCVDPYTQESEHNIASWFVSRCIKNLRERLYVRAVLSYADSRFHIGTVYQALGFTYCGLTEKRKDFWFELPDGTYKKHSRGKMKGCKGEWRNRPRKHRYVMVYDKTLNLKWKKEEYIKLS